TDFKFTDQERKNATVRFMTPNGQSLLESLVNEGSSKAANDPETVFKVKLREDELKSTQSAPSKQGETTS
ncbi:MAG: hypothetical protein ACK56F_06640, partial [bacterium]